jgi:PAS domain-containing protein
MAAASLKILQLTDGPRDARSLGWQHEGGSVKHVVARMKALGSAPRRRSVPATAAAAAIPDAWLFAAATQPVLIVEPASDRIVEANPAAAALLGRERAALLASSFLGVFAADSTPALVRLIATARLSGYGKRIIVRTRGAHDDDATRGGRSTRASRANRDIGVTLSMVFAGSESYLLVRLLPSAHDPIDDTDGEVPSPVLDAIEQAHEGFAVTDPDLRLSYANRAFIDMVGLESPAPLRGKSLATWLELSQADLTRLHDQMARREAVTVWKTVLRRSSLCAREVEVSAIAVPDGAERCWGFRIAPTVPAPLVTAI